MNKDDYPLDWDRLKVQRVDRDDGECVECGRSSEIYVIYEDDPEDAGYGVDNLRTLCAHHCPGEEKNSFTRITSETYDRVATGEPSGTPDADIEIDSPPVNDTDEEDFEIEVDDSMEEEPLFKSGTGGSSGGSGTQEFETDAGLEESAPSGSNDSPSGREFYTGDTVPFGKFLPYPRRLAYVIGTVVGASLLALFAGVVGTTALESPTAGYELAAGWVTTGIGAVVTFVTSPRLVVAAFAATYIPHLLHRDYGSNWWPAVRQPNTWPFDAEYVQAGAIGTLVAATAGYGVVEFTSYLSSGIFGRELLLVASIAAYVAGVWYAIVSLNTLALSDLDEMANPSRMFAWEGGMRVSAVAAVTNGFVGLGLPPRLDIALMVSPAVIGATYLFRRRSGFRLPSSQSEAQSESEGMFDGQLSGALSFRQKASLQLAGIVTAVREYVRRVRENEQNRIDR